MTICLFSCRKIEALAIINSRTPTHIAYQWRNPQESDMCQLKSKLIIQWNVKNRLDNNKLNQNAIALLHVMRCVVVSQNENQYLLRIQYNTTKYLAIILIVLTKNKMYQLIRERHEQWVPKSKVLLFSCMKS